jgi:glucose-6-phosphate 1-dehydrogenase
MDDLLLGGTHLQSPPCVFVLFGATGDLAARKIAPALYNLYADGLLGDNVAVLGVARRPRDDEQFRGEMLEAIRKHSRSGVDEKVWNRFARRWHYHVTQARQQQDFAVLARRLEEMDDLHGTQGSRLFYLATTPDTFVPISGFLGELGMAKPAQPHAFSRVVIEKPFGHDLDSAVELNRALLTHFDESQVFRIDHYLGKETVQNILVFRFANSIFEPLLNRRYVRRVEITATETVGMEGRRGPYYEGAGALRDMFQSHLLQLLALIAMDAPLRLRGREIHDEKCKVLRALSPMTPEMVAAATVRGQYGPGEGIAGYRQEGGVEAGSQTETFVAARLQVDNWRWAGVPFLVRTGKRMAAKASYIVIHFRHEPISLWTVTGCDMRGANRLVIRVGPSEGISMGIDAKVPGPQMLLRPVRMDFRYDVAFASASPEAYEHLLLDAMRGDATLFIRNDEVEASWRLVDTIRRAWDVTSQPPLETYAPGSWGPPQAQNLLEDAYSRWYDISE